MPNDKKKKNFSFSKKLPFMKSRDRSGSEDALSEGELCKSEKSLFLSLCLSTLSLSFFVLSRSFSHSHCYLSQSFFLFFLLFTLSLTSLSLLSYSFSLSLFLSVYLYFSLSLSLSTHIHSARIIKYQHVIDEVFFITTNTADQQIEWLNLHLGHVFSNYTSQNITSLVEDKLRRHCSLLINNSVITGSD